MPKNKRKSTKNACWKFHKRNVNENNRTKKRRNRRDKIKKRGPKIVNKKEGTKW